MFPFFHKDFFKSSVGWSKRIRDESSKWCVYRFSTNAIDEETFNSFRNKLEEAAKNKDQNTFDQTWNELTAKNQLIPSIETEFKNFHDHVQQLFPRNRPFFQQR